MREDKDDAGFSWPTEKAKNSVDGKRIDAEMSSEPASSSAEPLKSEP